MASAADHLQKEFQCPFCHDEMNRPKIMGNCSHSACQNCLEAYVETLGRTNAFECPLCRKECEIPPNGIADLQDDFKLVSIIDGCRKITAFWPIQCSASDCENLAESLCEKCDVFLCPACTKEHDIYTPGNHECDIIAICSSHGSTLSFYCRTCETAICSICKQCCHKGDKHDVTLYSKVVEELSDNVQAVLNKLEIDELQMSTWLDHLINKTADQITLPAKIKRASWSNKLNRQQEHSRCLQEHITALRKQKTTADGICKQLTKQLQNAEKETKNKLETRSKKCQENINLSLQSIRVLIKKVKAKLKLVTSRKTPLDSQSARDIDKIKHELTSFSHPETRTLMEEVKQLIDELEPSDCVKDFDNFSLGKTVADLSLPERRPCRGLFRVKALPDGRLVTLGRSSLWNIKISSEIFADTLYFHRNGSVYKTITEGIWPASDIAVFPTGQVLLLRYRQPILRLFDADISTSRDLEIGTAKKFTPCTSGDCRRIFLWSVETDADGNTMVDFGQIPHQHLIVLKTDGTVIPNNDSQESGYWKQHTLRAFNAADDQIVRFRGWSLHSLERLFLCQKHILRGLIIMTIIMTIIIGIIFHEKYVVDEIQIGNSVYRYNELIDSDSITRCLVFGVVLMIWPFISPVLMLTKKLIVGIESLIFYFGMLTISALLILLSSLAKSVYRRMKNKQVRTAPQLG